MYFDNLTAMERIVLEQGAVNQKQYENDCISGEIYQNFIASVINKVGVCDFPDYYGGSFIDASGKLVIYVSEGYEKAEKDLQERMNDSRFTIIPAKHSYKSLLNQLDGITKFRKENGCNLITAYALNDKENRVDMFLAKADKDEIDLLKSNLEDVADIHFNENMDMTIEYQASAMGGQKAHATSSSNSSYGTLAFRVKRNNIEGMMSAHHCFPYNPNKLFKAYDANGVEIGSSTASVLSLGVDACFIETNASYMPSNTMVDGVALALTLHTPVAGQLLFLRGAASGAQSGTLYSTAFVYDGDDGVTRSMYAANYSCALGDSGGTVYRNISGTRYACGIHCGLAKEKYSQDPTKYAIFSLASNACNQLNAYRYYLYVAGEGYFSPATFWSSINYS